MTTQHTPSLLKLHAKYPQDIVTPDGQYTVARTLPQPTIDVAEANARRLVACWNACDGFDVVDLEACPHGGLVHLAVNADQLKTDFDQLMAASLATLAKNLHLADGDNCTLLDLKRAVERITGVSV